MQVHNLTWIFSLLCISPLRAPKKFSSMDCGSWHKHRPQPIQVSHKNDLRHFLSPASAYRPVPKDAGLRIKPGTGPTGGSTWFHRLHPPLPPNSSHKPASIAPRGHGISGRRSGRKAANLSTSTVVSGFLRLGSGSKPQDSQHEGFL